MHEELVRLQTPSLWKTQLAEFPNKEEEGRERDQRPPPSSVASSLKMLEDLVRLQPPLAVDNAIGKLPNKEERAVFKLMKMHRGRGTSEAPLAVDNSIGELLQIRREGAGSGALPPSSVHG
eukprot:gene31040-7134_t